MDRPPLSRREREIMDILYRRKRATAADVLEDLADKPSYSAIRAHLRILEDKGHIQHEEQGTRYLYSPVVPHERARKSALRHTVDTFFEGSVEKVVASLLDSQSAKLSDEEFDRLAGMIKDAKERSRK